MHLSRRASRTVALVLSVVAIVTLVPSAAAHVEQVNPSFSAPNAYRGRTLANPRFRIEIQHNSGTNDSGYINYDIGFRRPPRAGPRPTLA